MLATHLSTQTWCTRKRGLLFMTFMWDILEEHVMLLLDLMWQKERRRRRVFLSKQATEMTTCNFIFKTASKRAASLVKHISSKRKRGKAAVNSKTIYKAQWWNYRKDFVYFQAVQHDRLRVDCDQGKLNVPFSLKAPSYAKFTIPIHCFLQKYLPPACKWTF